MPPKASSGSSSSSSAAGGARGQRAAAVAAAAGAIGASSLSGAAQPGSESQPESFSAEKLRWALAVPPEQRPPSMQGLIDSCECTTEATRLLEAAPLAQLAGPAKLRALLLLLKAYFSFGGRPPPIEGLNLKVVYFGSVSEQAQRNMGGLLELDAAGAHPELQPLWSVAAQTAYSIRLSSLAMGILGANITFPHAVQQSAHSLLRDAVSMLTAARSTMRQHGAAVRQQLGGVGGSLMTSRQLEREILKQLGVVHTWAATPDGAYRGGRVDEQQAAAGQAALTAALELSDGEAATSDMLSGLSNLLRRIGKVAEADAALRPCVAAARAAGDPLRQLISGWALASIIASKEGWRYAEVAPMVEHLQRCLGECKPWLPRALWTTYKEYTNTMERVLAAVRRAFPTSYATRRLPCWMANPGPNTQVTDRGAKQAGACSGCGNFFFELKFCARCQSAKYCSRACQVAHWKAGHKAECVPRSAAQ